MTPRTPKGPGTVGSMCRSIKTLRPPYADQVTDEDIRAAALQYVRKISGFRAPAGHNAEAFGHAVDAVAAATATLLDQLQVRSGPSTSRASYEGRPSKPERGNGLMGASSGL
jgi:hypothetical protein